MQLKTKQHYIMKYTFALLLLLALCSVSNAQTIQTTIQHFDFITDVEEVKPTPKQQKRYFQVGRFEAFDEFQIFIPKSFSPNRDGINDTFKIHSKNVLNFKMTVFNQWGEYIFTTENPNIEWDGTVEGKTLKEAPYIYVIQLKTMNGHSLKYSGCLMIEK